MWQVELEADLGLTTNYIYIIKTTNLKSTLNAFVFSIFIYTERIYIPPPPYFMLLEMSVILNLWVRQSAFVYTTCNVTSSKSSTSKNSNKSSYVSISIIAFL